MRTIDQILGPKDILPGNGVKWENRSIPLTERDGNSILMILHHSVSTTLAAIEGEFKSPNRTVSATAGIGPSTPGKDAYTSKQYVPWNTGRPYTTASSVDDRAITGETANLRLEPPWPVGSTAKHWWAELAAAMHVELGMPLDTAHILDHQQVYERGMGSYATECCGADLRDDIPDIINEAKQIVSGAGSGGADVKVYPTLVDTAKKELSGEDSARLRNTQGQAANIVGNPGPYSISLMTYAEGEPGDQLDVLLVIENASTGAQSDSYTNRLAIGADGYIRDITEAKITVSKGYRVFFRVRSVKGNKGTVNVTRQAATPYLFFT